MKPTRRAFLQICAAGLASVALAPSPATALLAPAPAFDLEDFLAWYMEEIAKNFRQALESACLTGDGSHNKTPKFISR